MEEHKTRDLWLKCMFKPYGNPDADWVTKIIRQPIPIENFDV